MTPVCTAVLVTTDQSQSRITTDHWTDQSPGLPLVRDQDTSDRVLNGEGDVNTVWRIPAHSQNGDQKQDMCIDSKTLTIDLLNYESRKCKHSFDLFLFSDSDLACFWWRQVKHDIGDPYLSASPPRLAKYLVQYWPVLVTTHSSESLDSDGRADNISDGGQRGMSSIH